MDGKYDKQSIAELELMLNMKKEKLRIANQELSIAYQKQIDCKLEVQEIEDYLYWLQSIPSLIEETRSTIKDERLGSITNRVDKVQEIFKQISDISESLSSIHLRDEYLNLGEDFRLSYYSNISESAQTKLLSELSEAQLCWLRAKEEEAQKKLDDLLRDN